MVVIVVAIGRGAVRETLVEDNISRVEECARDCVTTTPGLNAGWIAQKDCLA
jgi:hypothetical protein